MFSIANIFDDNMVLQRGEKTVVWGKAYPGEFVSLELNEKKCGPADEQGNWNLSFSNLKAGGPYES